MTVFIGYGYNARDKWIEQYVFPLAIAFGCRVQHGKTVYGGSLPVEVIEKIRKSDAMIDCLCGRPRLAVRLRVGGYCRCKVERIVVPLSIKQSQQYVGNDRWKWSVWLEGTPSELSDVERVVYILHPTFHKPVREVTDRRTNFRLDTSGWGTFRLYSKAFHRDGRETSLDHDLVLEYPDGTPTAA